LATRRAAFRGAFLAAAFRVAGFRDAALPDAGFFAVVFRAAGFLAAAFRAAAFLAAGRAEVLTAFRAIPEVLLELFCTLRRRNSPAGWHGATVTEFSRAG
jgi:hypothetical protein